MKKKFICAVCGYIYEGDAAPEKCPICKAPASKFSELKDDADMTYATVHKIGDGKPEGVSEEMIQDLRNHFNGECGEVGMYLAMARQADREGYPEIAEAFKRYAFEEADHASRFAELLGECKDSFPRLCLLAKDLTLKPCPLLINVGHAYLLVYIFGLHLTLHLGSF